MNEKFKWLRKCLLTIAALLIGTGFLMAQELKISGTVTSKEDGKPLPGVSVVIQGTTKGTTTDLDGKYSISASKGSVIVFSFIGMKKSTITVTGATTYDVVLEPETEGLNEVVVTAMGIKREEKALGYAVSSISAKDITLTGTTNFASALYGKAAGVRINAANGGASSAVNIQIRGVTSINNNTQPLYIVDGIPIRNHALLNYGASDNNASYWSETRVRENGILDIDPQDIESLTILKGASASALYGSEAANGVVVITTKKGTKKKGLGVDFNYQYDAERIAFQPDYQNTYGPGYDRDDNLAVGADENGWITDDDGSVHPYYRAYGQFGPKFDGTSVKYWDGTTRAYKAQKNNYKDFFDQGYNSTANISISNASDMGSYRLSYSRTDYKGIMPGSKVEKNFFNLNSTLKLSDKIDVDIASSFTNTLTHNRPKMLNQLFSSFSGFFSRFDDMNTYRKKYKTTEGYQWVAYNESYNDDEKLAYNIRATNILDYYWSQLKNSYNENQNRYINSATLNIKVTPKLNVRGRIGNDFTSVRTTNKEYVEYPVSYGNTGSFTIQNGSYNSLYGDGLITYNQDLSSDLKMTLTGGFTGKKDIYHDSSDATSDGLVIENWFNLSNSVNSVSTSTTTKKEAYMAAFGMADFSYKDFLYLQGTGRYEKTSTLPKDVNSYFYPSFNGSLILSQIMQLPAFINYAKLRGSWGIVGNHPEIYQASVDYTVSSVIASSGTAIYLYPSSSGYGNDNIKSEKKYESEIGLELSMLQNKVSLDLSYYYNKIDDQIMELSTAASSGATSMLSNVGDLKNSGVEVALTVTPVNTQNFRWDSRINYSVNKNKLDRIMEGVSYLSMYSLDGGSVIIRAAEGQALGDVYVHPIATDDSGNKIVSSDGLYEIDYNNYEKVGNVMPKAVGGFSNTFTYKNFALNFLMDYKFGGALVSGGMLYMTGAGMFKSTLKYRDTEHGGISYNIDDDGNKVQATNGTYNDGIILKGVDEDGNANTTIVDAATYYLNSFGWGSGSGYVNQYQEAVHKNSYIKLREVSLGYNLPKDFSQKIGFQRIQLSIIGKNLMYLWKTLPNNWDPESATGSSWLYQGIDQNAAAPTRSMGFAIHASF